VLITGESGTGKELIARAVHYNSPRVENPFIAINCGAIPSELLESELFGHVKGAFTGAIANRIGRFEMADGGTIFLDEIGDLEPALQVKILRALQERSFEPVGSTKSVSVNVRVIAATNKNLEQSVEEGRFREDLYYRLNVIPIAIPALRERRTDVPLLFAHFMDHFNRTKTRKLTGISPEAMESLSNYGWPGNIRELENLVERLAILKGYGHIEIHDLPVKYRSAVATSPETLLLEIPEAGVDFNTAVDQFENQLILRALEKTGWNRNQAALLLRLNRTTLVEKIKKKGLRPPGGTTAEMDL
jgi:transcriptional regulator with PAS, ATPase and Fis domain